MILVRAPLRLPLGGGGTDLPAYYCEHGGSLITAAIDKYVFVAVNRPSLDNLIRVKYSRSEEVEHLDDLLHDLVRPALRHLGLHERIEIASLADVGGGTGLGSSSSYLVALLLGLERLCDRVPDKQELAELACHIEMELAKHPVGKQDQYAAAYGGMISMAIARNGRVTVEPVALAPATIEAFERRVLLFFTGMQRNANDVLSVQAGELNRPGGAAVEAMHQTREIGERIGVALTAGDLDAFGALLHEHWEAKKRRSASVSLQQVDGWYEAARHAGATGGKLVGAGGGGFLMLHVPPDASLRVQEAMRSEGLVAMPYRFDWEGAKVLAGAL